MEEKKKAPGVYVCLLLTSSW